VTDNKSYALGIFMKVLSCVICAVTSLALAATGQLGMAMMSVMLCVASVSGGMDKLMQLTCPASMPAGDRLLVTTGITLLLSLACASVSAAIDSAVAAGMAAGLKVGVSGRNRCGCERDV